MKRIALRFGGLMRAALTLLPAVLPVAAQASRPPARGDLAQLPAITDDSGARLPIRTLQGRPVLVNFWASWCIPCRKELPSLDRLAARSGDLVVLAVSVDADRSAGQKAFEGRYPNLRLAYAPMAAVQAYGALGIPYSVVFDRRGKEIARVPRALAWDIEGAPYLSGSRRAARASAD